MNAKRERDTTILKVVRPTVPAAAGPLTLINVDLRDRAAGALTVATNIYLPHPPFEAHPARLQTTAGSTDVMVVPLERYDALLDALEEKEIAAVHASTRGEETFPLKIADRLAAGESPVRVFREHRGLTQQALADKIIASKAYISEIEAGKKPGSVDVIRRLAEALGVDVADLI